VPRLRPWFWSFGPDGENDSGNGNPPHWSSTTAYALNDIAVSNGTVYRCVQAHTNQATTNTGYWEETDDLGTYR
jgi:hypothetical protein